MKTRIDFTRISMQSLKPLFALGAQVEASGLEHALLELVKMRSSQLNGCAYCLDMHWKDLRAIGEPEHRLYGLDAWRESPFYSEQERAALGWAEEVTKIAETHAEDEAYDALRGQFTDQQIVELTFTISTINAWNRLAISFRAEPGHYKSQLGKASANAPSPNTPVTV